MSPGGGVRKRRVAQTVEGGHGRHCCSSSSGCGFRGKGCLAVVVKP